MVYFGGLFAKLRYFAGFSLHIINLAVRISAAMMAGDILFFKVPNSLQGSDGWGKGRGILFIKASLSHGKINVSGSPSSGLKMTILFLKISRGFLCIFRRKDQRSCDGWAE